MKKATGRQIITFDWAIKTVLRDKANFDVLEGFLAALFGRPIVILDLLESESNRLDDSDKYNHVDLLAKTQDDERIIVEVQYLSEMAYLKRLTYGTAKTIVETLKLGEPYANLKKVYSISLLHFDVSHDGDDYIYHGKTEFTGLHTHHPVTLKRSLVGDQIRIGETNVFPEYYLIPLKRFTDVVRDDLDQWVYAFKNNEVLDEFTAPGIGALKDKLDYLKLDERERRRFDKHIDAVRSEWGVIEHARWEAEEARQEGFEEGLAEGREEERKILVKSLYDNRMTIETIAASMGLSEPAIRRLLNDE
ncbi:Rpn family recombination-promoting nuclease/putative transposase [Candidatus Thiosymbion oneisti]|uniref:Rpn family recombination-promoting nuclease/putative transposase n=1 Tax=Candidatus Thiosymbion oneisti TaxID=589554 RepID=UPI000B7C9C9B|nr:Rpn family recombination-promoting nuclease/putative transposase [Candidatus Thiosymbion oneisti]